MFVYPNYVGLIFSINHVFRIQFCSKIPAGKPPQPYKTFFMHLCRRFLTSGNAGDTFSCVCFFFSWFKFAIRVKTILHFPNHSMAGEKWRVKIYFLLAERNVACRRVSTNRNFLRVGATDMRYFLKGVYHVNCFTQAAFAAFCKRLQLSNLKLFSCSPVTKLESTIFSKIKLLQPGKGK